MEYSAVLFQHHRSHLHPILCFLRGERCYVLNAIWDWPPVGSICNRNLPGHVFFNQRFGSFTGPVVKADPKRWRLKKNNSKSRFEKIVSFPNLKIQYLSFYLSGINTIEWQTVAVLTYVYVDRSFTLRWSISFVTLRSKFLSSYPYVSVWF